MKDNLIVISKLLGDFNNFIEKRSTTFLTRPDGMLGSILQWHFKLWKKEHEYLGQENMSTEWVMYNGMSSTTDSIFRQIERRALKENGSYSFLKKFEKHAEEYKKESVSSFHYVQHLLTIFYQVFFESIYESPHRFDVWEHFFPKKWKVTMGNLQGSENTIPQITLNKFLAWAIDRIQRPIEKTDSQLDDALRNLFPEVDPILWAKILIFVFSSYGEDRLRSVIERPWNFGFIGRFKVYAGPSQEEIRSTHEVERTNTFDLAYFLFKEQFSEDNLEGYIKSLEKLSYQEDSVEEDRRLRLYNLFTEMLVFSKKT